MTTPIAFPTNRPRFTFLRAWAIAFFFLGMLTHLPAFTLPPGFSEHAIGGGWVEPVGVAFDPHPDAAGRVYVWERAGRVWIVENGVKLATPLIDISDEVGAWRDFGMLGVALHPDFHTNGFIYLSYVVDRHHLLNAGTPAYNPATNEYFAATIGRIARYTARASDGFHSVDPASRKVLVGETKTTGFPIVHQSHGVGHLAFGSDGTLLASCGETANFDEVDNGSNPALTYAPQAMADGILSAKENVGAFRAQLIDSLGGKIVRIDAETGDGVPGNPFFDPANPRAARSRVWALGFRNPFRFTIRPGTGGPGDPGVIVLGDVGWGAFEEIDVLDGPGKNCGWPLFEGLTSHASFEVAAPENADAPNPLGGFFTFRDLLIQETLATPSWPNPLEPAQQIPASVPHFMHTRPVFDIGRLTNPDGPARAATFFDTTAGEIAIGDPASPVAGPQFGANASVGGVFYTGSDFPVKYRDAYFHADFGYGWIKAITFDANHRATEVSDFASGGTPVFLATHPALGALYAVDLVSANVFKITYAPGGNVTPTASATAGATVGISPLAVTFDGTASQDADGLPLTYLWDFGDGTTSSEAAPDHVFTAAGPRRFDVLLTVFDPGGGTAQTSLRIFVNDAPPQVTLLSPIDGAKYSLAGDTEYALRRLVVETPGHPTTTRWSVFLHHDEHEHAEPAVFGAEAVALISPIHSLTESYFFRIRVTVIDDLGLEVIREARLYPNASNVAPQPAWTLASQTLTANPSPQILDATATLADADSAGIEFGKLRVEFVSARAGDALTLLPEGNAPGQVGRDGSAVTFGGVRVGAISGGADGTPLEITFNEAATPAAAQAILRRIAGSFSTPGTRTAVATLNDGDGGIGATAALSIEVAPPPNLPPTVVLKKPANLSTHAAPATLALVADASDADGSVVKVEFFSGATLLGNATVPPFKFVWSGVSPGVHSLTARATDDRGGSATSLPANIRIAGADALPAGWSAQDVGIARGRATSSAGKFKLRAAGAGLGASADAIHFAWQPWTGDGEILARVDAIRDATPQSFAALTFRESLLPNARHVSLTLSAAARARMKWRDGIAPALQRSPASTLPAPGWLKLTRRGTSFVGSVSADGIAWTDVGTATVALSEQCFVGLEASASSADARSAVVFSNVAIQRPPAP